MYLFLYFDNCVLKLKYMEGRDSEWAIHTIAVRVYPWRTNVIGLFYMPDIASRMYRRPFTVVTVGGAKLP